MNPSHVPLGLELGKLPAVVDRGEGLPQEERDEADADDGADEAEDDAGEVGRGRAQPVLVVGGQVEHDRVGREALGRRVVRERVVAPAIFKSAEEVFNLGFHFHISP